MGISYARAEFVLDGFVHFVAQRWGDHGEVVLEDAITRWCARIAGRKAVTVANEFGVVRQLCLYRRRRDPSSYVPEHALATFEAESAAPLAEYRATIDRLFAAVAPELDARVTLLERTNARSLSCERLPFAPSFVTADLSFISLTVALGPVTGGGSAAPAMGADVPYMPPMGVMPPGAIPPGPVGMGMPPGMPMPGTPGAPAIRVDEGSAAVAGGAAQWTAVRSVRVTGTAPTGWTGPRNPPGTPSAARRGRPPPGPWWAASCDTR